MGRHHQKQDTDQRTRRDRRLQSDGKASSWASLSLPQRIVGIGLIVAAIATMAGLIMQWPPNEDPPVSEQFSQTSGLTGELVDGTVVAIEPGMCGSPSQGKVFATTPQIDPGAPRQCTHHIVEITSGEDEGQRTLLEINPEVAGNPQLADGDDIVLSTHAVGGSYAFQDYQRSTALWLWLGAALLLIALVGAWRGVRSIVGLAITLGVIAVFLVPGLIHGGSAIMLALTCGAAVLFLVLFLVHGLSWKTASAMAGTLMALVLAVGLSTLAVRTANIRGLGDENNLNILVYLPGVSIAGLMLAGMIIGALGVLNDVTIAQASTVNELKELNPEASGWQLFRSAMQVGRDHIASMVYTLVLSYTGVALPTLLLLSVSGRPLVQVLTSDIMATEILRSITGAIALVLAVPLTTAIAAVVVRGGGERAESY